VDENLIDVSVLLQLDQRSDPLLLQTDTLHFKVIKVGVKLSINLK
jgi:hypothetical protein